MPLETRRPTGEVALPLILLEGEEGAGKTVQVCKLAASTKVGRVFVFPYGERKFDEYASLGSYEIVETNGTVGDLTSKVEEAKREPRIDGKPNVIAVDSGTFIWSTLSKWADDRARSSTKGRAALERDPNADIDISINLWNDSKERWRDLYFGLMTWDGIGIITARGSEVVEVVNGSPTKNRVWSVQAEKNAAFDATVWIRCTRTPRKVKLIAARSLFVNMPDGHPIDLPLDNPLEHLVFDLMGGGQTFGPSNTVLPVVGVKVSPAKRRLVAALVRSGMDEDAAKAKAPGLWAEHFPDLPTEVTEAELGRLLAKVEPTGLLDGPAEGEELAAPAAVRKGLSLDDAVARWRAMNNHDLTAELVTAGLATSGNTSTRVARLVERFYAAPEAPVGDGASGGDTAAQGAVEGPLEGQGSEGEPGFEECPGCGVPFRADQLPAHMAACDDCIPGGGYGG